MLIHVENITFLVSKYIITSKICENSTAVPMFNTSK